MNVHVVSDFNIQLFENIFDGIHQKDRFSCQCHSYIPAIPQLLDSTLTQGNNQERTAVVWTQPQAMVPTFNQAIRFSPVSIENILQEVDHFADSVLVLAANFKYVFVWSWVLPAYRRGYGLLEMKKDVGFRNILMAMNLRLSEKLAAASNVYLLSSARLLEEAGAKAFNDKLWYTAKMPYTIAIYQMVAKEIVESLDVLSGKSKKLIIVDLDDTLWGGTVGETGWEQLRLGGHDPIGEAYKEFQRTLKSYLQRGILLGIVSKNEEQVAWEAIEQHPEMVLKREDFVGGRINWDDKAKNIVSLVNELNLGLDAVVFIDNNPYERARVKEALPQVLVPDWPDDVMQFPRFFLSLPYFDNPQLSQEDGQRNFYYAAEKKRAALLNTLDDVPGWLKTLQTKVYREECNEANFLRIVQLFNKTNQMNLSTRRLSEEELRKWLKPANRRLWSFRVSDKLGDSGLVGIVSVETGREDLSIIDFVLSCRVWGRKIEETMVFTAFEFAKQERRKKIIAHYLPTPRNGPCLQFWQRSGFQCDREQSLFTWDVNNQYLLPEEVEYVQPVGAA